MLEMTNEIIKLLGAEYSLHITISIMRILTAEFTVFTDLFLTSGPRISIFR